MKENKYDEIKFFDEYKKMDRSQRGLKGAGEWYTLKQMLPSFENKDVLDLGCGYGWHCRYAIENGAKSVVGIDLSIKMLGQAKAINQLAGIEYIRKAIEDVSYPANHFDIVLSSLAFHYLASFDNICRNVHHWLKPKGSFVFSVEHPVFTAEGTQNWIYDEKGQIQYWPIDRYFDEGKRKTTFIGESVIKYHRTLTTYLNGLLKRGFNIKEVREPSPSEEMLKTSDEMQHELRRPMMLLIAAEKE